MQSSLPRRREAATEPLSSVPLLLHGLAEPAAPAPDEGAADETRHARQEPFVATGQPALCRVPQTLGILLGHGLCGMRLPDSRADAIEDREPTALGVLPQELSIARPIAIAEEHVRPAVGALRDVMGLAWNGDSGAPRHGRSPREWRAPVKEEGSVPFIPLYPRCEAKVRIPGDRAFVLVSVPSESRREIVAGRLLCDGIVVDYRAE